MKGIDMRVVSAATLLILTIISGMITTRAGRPLNTLLFTFHKLLALAAVILFIMAIVQLKKGVVLTPLIWSLIILTGLFVIALFATGGMLSFEKQWPAYVLLIHRLSPLLTAVSATAAVYLMVNIK